jgi:hypothetical protein
MDRPKKPMFQDYADRPEPAVATETPAHVAKEALQQVPPPPGDLEKYAAFFRDLDSYTEYWDLYRPETNGRYMDAAIATFGAPLQSWTAYALKENSAQAPALLAKLKAALAVAENAQALRTIDELLLMLLQRHFPGPAEGQIEAGAYVNAVEGFARDVLPPDPDRLARTPSDDSRYAYAGRHRMDGAVMWFNWAGVLDCVDLLDGDAAFTPHRTVQIAAAAFGSAMDYAFRGQVGFRGKTRPEYKPDEPTVVLLRSQVKSWIADGTLARGQARELFRIFKS